MLFAARCARNAHRRILAVTFTKKATAEMKQRIVKELSLLAQAKQSDFAADLKQTYNLTDTQLQEHAQQILYDLLQDFGTFAVSTIDSFFQQVIRSFSRELGLSGKYNLELDTNAINQMAVDELFLNLKEEDKTTFNLLLDIVRENMANDKAWDPKANLLQLSNELFNEEVMLHRKELFAYLKDTDRVQAFQQQVNQTVRQHKIDYEKAQQYALTFIDEHGIDTSKISYSRDVLAPILGRYDVVLEKAKKGMNRFRTFVQEHEEHPLQPALVSLYDLLFGERMRRFITAKAIQQNFAYLLLLGKVSEVVEQKNKQLNRLSIADTNMLLTDVIRANEVSPFIYEKLGTRIRHFLIDEFQDTSAMQWTSFRPLISESLATNHANLVVGDVKQSIYRFRNSDYSLMFRQIARDFHHAQLNNLQGNWRSSKTVVDFNNTLFGLLSQTLNQEMNTLLDGRYSHLQNVLQDVYEAHEQRPMLAGKAAEGFVQIRFSEEKKKEDWQNEVLSCLPEMIADIEQRGIPLGRVACLIRNNSEATPIANTLIAAGYKVVSSEGLLLTASVAVQYIIYTLKKRLYPDDKIIDFCYNHYAHSLGLRTQDLGLRLQDLFSSVSEIVRGMVISAAEKPYVTALLDVVYDYSNKYTADLYSFLTWWDEHSDKLSLSQQETVDAIQIVSIHKSKGLEYDVVIVPFCNWDKAAKARGNIKNMLWVRGKTPQEPPLLPITFDKTLACSDFAEAYYEELLNLYLDNLNMTYVAFTRAKTELYIFAPLFTPTKSTPAPSNMGKVLHAVMSNQSFMECEEIDGVAYYRMGEKVTMNHEPLAVSPASVALRVAPSGSQLKTATLRLPSRDFFGNEDYETPRELGLVMHQILQHIQQKGDEQRVIAEQIRNGLLREEHRAIIEQRMAAFWQLLERENKTDWFDTTQYTILNEQDILLPDGSTKRPDRILIAHDSQPMAIIIDYKFGGLAHSHHATQVRGYLNLLQQMGYTVEGYLCYVTLNKIVSVSL